MKDWKKHMLALAGTALFGIAASAYADQGPAAGGSSGHGMARGMMGGHGPESMGRGMMTRGHRGAAASTGGMGLENDAGGPGPER